ncbi:hypothetical protein BH11CYA1_BH11CYA1_15210 [soil metagenome]
MENPDLKPETGFAHHFERRPEFLFGSHVDQVVDASSIRERTVKDLRVYRVSDLFSGKNEIFLGFGLPNVYLTVPDGKGAYEKFAAKSLRRAPCVVEDTRNFVQSGIMLRLLNLPAHAAEKLRASMRLHVGKKYMTCVNANLRVLEDAGFTSGPRKLSSIFMPYALLSYLLSNGLKFEGKTVELEVVRTTQANMESYARQIIAAEFMTFCRHGERMLEAKSQTSKVWRAARAVVRSPFNLVSAVGNALGLKSAAAVILREVAPALPASAEYHRDFTVKLSVASSTGTILRQFWGAHALFTGEQTRVNPLDYLRERLKPFPQKNPNFVTRLKKRVLFSKFVIKLIHKVLAPNYADLGLKSERDIYDMLRTDSAKKTNKYNLVITVKKIIVARTTVGVKIIDWVLSKHVLASGYDPDVLFAGEVWKDSDGVIHINANSGTYQPSDQELEAVGLYMKAVFPHLRVVVDRMEHGA